MGWKLGIVIAAAVAGAALVLAALLSREGLATPAVVAHATLMLTAWGVLLPCGGIVARYFKVTPRQNYPAEVDNLFWFNTHRVVQYAGMAVATAGLALIVSETGGRFDTWHGRCGLVVMLVGWLQIVSTWLRGHKGGPADTRADPADPLTWRGDHYDMTRRRLIFEAWHKRAGWAVLALAGVTVLLGVELVGAPSWLVGLAGGLQAAAVLGIVDGRLRGRWVDTYHAIWGPDPVHPGNRKVSAAPSRPRRWQSRR